jgi:transmembrane sensor
MSAPEEPLRSLLVGDATETEIRNVWQAVQRARARASGPKPGLRSLWRVGGLGVAVLAAFCVWFVSVRGASSTGPLRDLRGQLPNRLSATTSSTTLLADGSRIELDSDSELEVLDNDSSVFSCVLRKGRGTFDVKPGGPRHWRIETSLVLVEVVGTHFVVERQEKETRVSVQRGSVIVRGERVPDGVQKLSAGQRLVVTPRASAGLVGASTSASGTAVAAVAATATPSVAAAPPSGVPDSVAAAAPRAATNLLQSADEQRRRGDVRGAIQTLRAAVAGGTEPSRRAIAAFTLGKLLLDAAGRPGEAEGAFRTCLRLSPPGAVAEDALARLVEAQVRAGKAEAARGTARQYEQRYPSGRRLVDVQRWVNNR